MKNKWKHCSLITQNVLSMNDHLLLSLGSEPPNLSAHHNCQGTLKMQMPKFFPSSMNQDIWRMKSQESHCKMSLHWCWHTAHLGNHCSREPVRGHLALLNVRRYIFLFYSSYWKFNSDWLFKTYPLKPHICLIDISYYTLVLRVTVKTWHNRRHGLNKLIT